jgi:hypothetical protein
LGEATYQKPVECYTHGNLTLENVLYHPGERRVIFIDPYEENVIDSHLAEYSQLAQSANSYYEILNAASPLRDGNRVTCEFKRSKGLDQFNDLMIGKMKRELTDQEIVVVRLLEISQYARMLPFKMEVAPEKMALFYALGSVLFQELQQEVRGK